MSNHLFAARIVDRAFRDVRRSKTPMYQQESGDKSNRLRKQLVRLRAEYKIRKIRRWVRRAVTFVPKHELGWFKAVRICLNLKFRKGPAEPEREFEQTTSDQFGLLRRIRETRLPDVVDPFPFWWAWWKESRGRIVAFFGRSLNMSPGFVPKARIEDVTWGDEPADDEDPWTLPEALGGPHLVAEEAVDEDGFSHLVRKKFTWDLPGGTFNWLDTGSTWGTTRFPASPLGGLGRLGMLEVADLIESGVGLTSHESGREDVSWQLNDDGSGYWEEGSPFGVILEEDDTSWETARPGVVLGRPFQSSI